MYAKVFSQIFDGTLCTVGPWEALVTFQQLLILADQEGSVDMTTTAISRRTTVPLEIIEKGIAALLLPDPESRTPDEGGRRIVPLSEGRAWGWRVVNYKHYRQMKREEDRRTYHREYWQQKRSNPQKLNKTQHAQPNQPIAEAEAEASPKSPSGADGLFERFWLAYPNKKNKAGARKAFAKLKLVDNDARIQSMRDGLARQKQSREWLKDGGEYIPHASTWLNGARWEDETTPAKVIPIGGMETALQPQKVAL
jgi:hypothetical protein